MYQVDTWHTYFWAKRHLYNPLFNFNGVAYLNLEFQKPDGSLHIAEYEPVLVSPDVSTCTFGIKTALRFKETRRKQEDRTLTFLTADKQEIVVPFYKETERSTSAYIKVSKVTVVNDGDMKLVKAKIQNGALLKPSLIYENIYLDNSGIAVGDDIMDEIQKTVKVPVYSLIFRTNSQVEERRCFRNRKGDRASKTRAKF